MKKLNERQQFRRRAGLTQHRLAKLSKISAGRLSLWENGETELSHVEVERIARVIAGELRKLPSSSTETEVVARSLRLEVFND